MLHHQPVVLDWTDDREISKSSDSVISLIWPGGKFYLKFTGRRTRVGRSFFCGCNVSYRLVRVTCHRSVDVAVRGGDVCDLYCTAAVPDLWARRARGSVVEGNLMARNLARWEILWATGQTTQGGGGPRTIKIDLFILMLLKFLIEIK
jgi:hypothetical protein